MFVPAAHVLRGEGVDAVHCVAIAVVDGNSRLTHALGDPQQNFFARSSLKPFQVLPLVEAGGLERFGFDSEALALCASSHSGSDRHRAVALRMLERQGLDASALQCGAAWPAQLQLFDQYPLQGEDRDPLRHMCSGKHSGFLALAQLLGQPVATYLDPAAPVQQAVRHAVATACEVDEASLLMGVDGCSAPNYAFPLLKLAAGLKNLALASATTPRGAALARVRDAMLAHPLLVSGERRLDYDLSQAFPRRIVVKSGAEGLLLLAFEEPALGIAIKILDGSPRALGPVAIETMKQLGLIDDLARFPSLQPHERPSIKNARGTTTGEIRVEFRLQPAEADSVRASLR
jgi:L-asparaginase II